jgi:glycosyltransferase involved in cell wall biosynthesis
MNWIMPGKRRAAALIVANRRTRDALPAGVCQRVIELVENGVELGLWNDAAALDGAANESDVRSTEPAFPADVLKISTPTTFVFMGRLVGWKAVDILLNAFARASKAAPMRLWILGDGDEMKRLVSLAAELSISVPDRAPSVPGADTGTVRFYGWMPQDACATLLRQSDCLVLPSLFECGGAVVLEAMAAGKPVIATAWGGPVDYLDESCGVLVAPTSPLSFVDDLAAALVRMASSESLRLSMGAHGRAKVARQFDWELKVDEMLAIYGELSDKNGRRSGGDPRPV